jgi:dTDP-4-amino-4,6-dideoxygalactose transaminase
MRRANAARYGDRLKDAGLTDRVVLPSEPAGYHHIYPQYVVCVPRRDAVSQRLAAAGIGTEVHYPMPFHLQECFASLGYQRGAFPRAEAAAESARALPVYGELTALQQDAVVAALANALSA